MSFRRAIFVAILAAVVATIVIEAVSDFIVDDLADNGLLDGNRLLLDLSDIPLSIAVGVLIAWVLTRLVGRRLGRFVRATEAVADEEYRTRVEVPPGGDELAALAASFNRMAEAVEHRIEREQAFSRYAFHELRTPLTALKLQIDRLEAGLADESAVLPVLKRQADHLGEVLVALDQLSRGGLSPVGQRPLAEVLDTAVAGLPPDERARVEVRNELTGTNLPQPILVRQAVQNLLSNALRHGSGRVTLEVRRSGDALNIVVRDMGDGVAEEQLQLIVQPGHSGPVARRAGRTAASTTATTEPSSGLGLSLVSFIARALEGSLQLRNAVPGLEATLVLPLAGQAAREL